ncbi:hypothetical protein AB0Y14_07610 [Rothia sp. HC945]|uniref:hypothetical protein n=1 Tax=Rothia sp. HC945 TaxID=3171170 RepID=UPI003F1E4BE4
MRTKSLNMAIVVFVALIFLLFYLLKNEIIQGMVISVGLLVCLLGISSCVVLIALRWSRDREHNQRVHRGPEDYQHDL